MTTTYDIKGLTTTQVRAIIKALDLSMRIIIGQFTEITSLARFGEITDCDGKQIAPDHISEAEDLLNQAKMVMLHFSSNTSKGIGGQHTGNLAKTMYEIEKVLQHRLAWDRNPKGGIQVHFDEPYLLKLTDEPKITIVANNE